jgi:hypothetical protein
MSSKPIEQDILEVLEQAISVPGMAGTDGKIVPPGSARGDVNVIADPAPVPRAVIRRAIREIRWLRTMAGAVTQGETFVEFRNQAKEPVLRVHSAYDVTYGDRQVVGFTDKDG